MGKTFLIGFIGLVLVGALVTGLYLLNQRTNPASSASGGEELVNPVKPPPTNAPSEKPTFSICEKLFGSKKGELKYDAKCDLDNDGTITIRDLQKLK